MKKLSILFTLLFLFSTFFSLTAATSRVNAVSPKYGSSVTLVADSSMYQNTKLVTGIAAEIGITVGTGGLGTVGKLGTLGKVVRAYDMLGSGVSMGRGAYGYAQGDFSFNNTLSILGGIAGFGEFKFS